MAIYIEPSDFHWWRTSREKIKSSRSLISFSHYKAQSYSKQITARRVEKLNLRLCVGLPSERWLYRITLLLKKESGNIDIDKLQAIILFEANFSWLLKLIFSKKLMRRAIEINLLPHNYFAQQGTSVKNEILSQTLWCDINRLQHRTIVVVSTDLSQCYNSIRHA